MGKLSLDLSQFKSSGVYTIEIDQSERVSVTAQTLRLVPGFSSVGVQNSPVFIRSTADRQKFYGDIDRKLERKGSFFHRSIDTCLLSAPVFAISLLNANATPGVDNKDKVQFAALSLNAKQSNYDFNGTKPFMSGLGLTTNVHIPTPGSDLYVNFFNRQRFWTPDTENLEGVIINKSQSSSASTAPLFQLVNLGTQTVSIITRKSQNVEGYDVFAKDWYGNIANIPFKWIRPYDKISDYFIDIIAIAGDWSNYGTLALDPYYSSYFSNNGLDVEKLEAFLSASNVNVIGSWTGCIIPEFKDLTGNDKYIETVVNAAQTLTGIFMNINNKALDELTWIGNGQSGSWVLGDGDTSTGSAEYLVDLVGHNFINDSSIQSQFLSYLIDAPTESLFHTIITADAADSTNMLFYLDPSMAGINDVQIGSLVEVDPTKVEIYPGVTRITNKYYDYESSQYIIETAEPAQVTNGTIKLQKTIDDLSLSPTYIFTTLAGLTITNNHKPGYSKTGAPDPEEGVEKIYSMLTKDSGILRGLTNPEMIQYRYIIDTMAYGLRPELGGKAHLSKLAKLRGKTTAILNAPAMSQFAASQNPYFCDIFVPGVDAKPVFDTAYIPTGGNPNMPRSYRFSLPSEDNGAKYCGVFGPFLKYIDNGRIISVPPAADVANAFARKYLGGDPYAIVANRNGILSNSAIAGVEYMIDKTDRDNLEPFGYNSIIERASTSQVMIYSNATSFQTVKTDYNYLHVRELLNTVEIQVEEILKNYVFDYNNPITRLNIINTITPILNNLRDAGVIEKYTISMDDTVNTPEVIAEGVAIIDIGLWINKGMQKIVSRISVNRTSTTAQ